MTEPLELILRRDPKDERRLLLCAPDVGLFTAARRRGCVLVPGDGAGYLSRLGLARRLVLPAGAAGAVANANPERVHAPVEYGEVLYVLEPLGDSTALDIPGTGAQETLDPGGALVVPAPQAGRFWLRPSPEDAAYCSPGDELELGSPLGLIEIMKTFTQVAYQPGGNLPARARVVRLLVPDGSEVTEGQPLIEVAPL